MPLRHAAVSAALLLTLAACGGGGSGSHAGGDALMRPGEDCVGCHREFTAAGTVYAAADGAQGVAGVQVIIEDGVHNAITMTTNGAGNFYTTASFTYGAGTHVSVIGANTQMASALSHAGFAGCNACHVPGGQGRIHRP